MNEPCVMCGESGWAVDDDGKMFCQSCASLTEKQKQFMRNHFLNEYLTGSWGNATIAPLTIQPYTKPQPQTYSGIVNTYPIYNTSTWTQPMSSGSFTASNSSTAPSPPTNGI